MNADRHRDALTGIGMPSSLSLIKKTEMLYVTGTHR